MCKLRRRVSASVILAEVPGLCTSWSQVPGFLHRLARVLKDSHDAEHNLLVTGCAGVSQMQFANPGITSPISGGGTVIQVGTPLPDLPPVSADVLAC